MTGYVKPKGNTKRKDERDGSTQPDKAMLRSKEIILSVKRAGTNRKKVRPIVEGALGGFFKHNKKESGSILFTNAKFNGFYPFVGAVDMTKQLL